MKSPQLLFWAIANIAIYVLLGSLLPNAAMMGQQNRFVAYLVLALFAIAILNQKEPSRWIGSLIIFSSLETPTMMVNNPVSIAGLSLLPYKFIGIITAAILLATSAGVRHQIYTPTNRLFLVGGGLVAATVVGSALVSPDPTISGGKAITILACLVSATALAIFRAPIETNVIRASIFAAICLVFAFGVYQAALTFLSLEDTMFWFRFEPRTWLRLGDHGPQRFYATFHNPNYLAIWAVVMFSLAGVYRTGIVPRAMCIVLALGSLSGSGIAALSIAWVLPYAPRKLLPIVALMLIAAPIVALPIINALPPPTSFDTLSGRITIAHAAATAIGTNPFLGVGVGVLEAHYDDYGPPLPQVKAPAPHNLILETWVGAGAVGLMGICMLLFGVFQQSTRIRPLSAGVIAVLWWAELQPGITWMPLWFLIGFMLITAAQFIAAKRLNLSTAERSPSSPS